PPEDGVWRAARPLVPRRAARLRARSAPGAGGAVSRDAVGRVRRAARRRASRGRGQSRSAVVEPDLLRALAAAAHRMARRQLTARTRSTQRNTAQRLMPDRVGMVGRLRPMKNPVLVGISLGLVCAVMVLRR